MTTVINNPGTGESSSSAMGMIVGIIVLIIVVALFVIYVLPGMRGTAPATQDDTLNVNIEVPTQSPSGTN